MLLFLVNCWSCYVVGGRGRVASGADVCVGSDGVGGGVGGIIKCHKYNTAAIT